MQFMDEMQWMIDVPMFRNRYILRGLTAAVGIPFGIVIAVIVIVSKGDIFGTDAKYALGLILLLFLLTYFLILAVYGAKYAAGYIVNDKGVTNYSLPKQAKRSRIINGYFGRNRRHFGTAKRRCRRADCAIQANHGDQRKNIRKVVYDPKRSTILIRGGLTEKIAVFCLDENYGRVAQTIREKTGL
jgi:hypothetical protein